MNEEQSLRAIISLPATPYFWDFILAYMGFQYTIIFNQYLARVLNGTQWDAENKVRKLGNI